MLSVKILIRLCNCAGWSESSLGAHARWYVFWCYDTYELRPAHDKTYKAAAPSEDSDQPGHPPSLIRVFTVRIKKAWVINDLLSTQRRLWSDWADAQADLSLRCARMPFSRFIHALAHIYFSFRYCHHVSVECQHHDIGRDVWLRVSPSSNHICLLLYFCKFWAGIK